MVGKRQKQFEVAYFITSFCVFIASILLDLFSLSLPLCVPYKKFTYTLKDIYICTTGDGDSYLLFKAKSFSLSNVMYCEDKISQFLKFMLVGLLAQF